jgi:glycyl-tRNA synthetase beta chain
MSVSYENKKDLLIEIGTEELPPKALKRLSQAFGAGIKAGLEKEALSHGEISLYAAPRRLAVLVCDLVTGQQDKEVQRRGPAVTAAFGDDGCPTPAATGFARSCGVEVDALDKLETDKGAWLVFNSVQAGKQTADLIPQLVTNALDQLPIPKRMRWGALKAEFVRPVHWIVLLFGDEVIDTEILTVKAGRETRGHRFHHPDTIYIGEPRAYAPVLESEGHVIADFNDRREAVRAQVLEVAAKLGGAAVIDEELLDEVASMVEWPIAVSGDFEERFLEVPPEVLITTMKTNQKYFHVVDKQDKLLPHFITVSNIDSKDVQQVREGNERVVRPRLEDADFFWNQDRKHKLESMNERLKSVVFQNKLGSVFDKVQRVEQLAEAVAEQLGSDKALARRAALLCKCDLMTEMVGEFPSLQGIMGRYYAQHDKEPIDVATALDEQYMPRFAGDHLPLTPIGQAVAIADKLDTITGIFAIGQIPTGDKDPFALRRAALGIMRIIIERELPLDLLQLIHTAVEQFSGVIKDLNKEALAEQVYDFTMERLRAYYSDAGIAADVFEAVLAQRPTQPYDFHRRIEAVNQFRTLPEAESLAAANKRIANIIRQADITLSEYVQDNLLSEKSERVLATQIDAMAQEIAPLFEAKDYQQALTRLAGLREAVDKFFDDVMVMVDDEELRNNRLALLGRLRNLFLRVADVSHLQS